VLQINDLYGWVHQPQASTPTVREVDVHEKAREFVHRGRPRATVARSYIARRRDFISLNVSLTFCLYKIVHSSLMNDMGDYTVPDWQVEGTLAAAERAAITSALAHCGNSRTQAANRLRCGRSSLYRKMKEYEIMIPLRAALSAPRPKPHAKLPVVLIDNEQYVIVRKRELA
jgi:DNA-binding protein Fis